jgi:hypothetical protein
LGNSGLSQWRGEFVIVRGTPSIYVNKHTGKKQVQIQIDQASQIELSPIPGLAKPTVPTLEEGVDAGED